MILNFPIKPEKLQILHILHTLPLEFAADYGINSRHFNVCVSTF